MKLKEANKLDNLKESISYISITGLGGRIHLPNTFERDGQLFVSAEDGGIFADYYGEFTDGYPWIDKKLEDAAKKHGFFWEWENPGCIVAVAL